MVKIKPDCTIIIPTFNRPYCLGRILEYYDKCGKDFEIIVADSSSDENKEKNKKIIALFTNLNISYLSDYPSEINPFQKWCDALNRVESKYCVFCADDDFITPNGIDQSVGFLEKNPKFTTAHGRYIHFELKDDKTGKPQFYWKTPWICKSITCENLEDRLKFFFSNFYSDTYVYSVYRTDFFKFIFNECMKFTNHVQANELFFVAMTLIYGKIKNLDVLYGVREYGSMTGAAIKKRDWILEIESSGTYDEEYNKFKEGLAAHISKNSELTIEQSKKVVDENISIYIKKYYTYSTSSIDKVIARKVRMISHDLYKILRELYYLLFKRSEKVAYYRKYHYEIDKIRLYVIKYYTNCKMYGSDI